MKSSNPSPDASIAGQALRWPLSSMSLVVHLPFDFAENE